MKIVGTSMMTIRFWVSFRSSSIDVRRSTAMEKKCLNVDQMTADIPNSLLNFHNTITFKVLYVIAFC